MPATRENIFSSHMDLVRQEYMRFVDQAGLNIVLESYYGKDWLKALSTDLVRLGLVPSDKMNELLRQSEQDFLYSVAHFLIIYKDDFLEVPEQV